MMKYQGVQEMFSKAAKKFGKRAAIEVAGKRMTYAELEAQANNLANFLIYSGAQPGSIVAIMVENIPDIISSIIGILKARCVFVPFDISLPQKRLELMVKEISPKWFITRSSFSSKLNDIAIGCGVQASFIYLDAGEGEHADEYASYSNTTSPAIYSEPDDPCYIYFTSGSTGTPKAILGCAKGLDHFIRWEIDAFGIGEGTRVSQFTPPMFDPFLRDIFAPLCAGGVVCVPDGKEMILQAKKLIDWIDIQQINLIHCVPFMFRLMVNEELSPYYFSSLKHILLAGEPLPPIDAKKWMAVFGDRIQLVNVYGPTETTLAKFFHIVNHSDLERQSIPVGKPIEGATALIVDDEGNLCGPGSAGEVYIQTPFRSLGYYNRPEQTREVFLQNPFGDNPNDILYKTGDLGRLLPDGNLELLGRKDLQVKIRGVRIELHEIENLLRRHEAIKDAVVIDRTGVDGQKYLCAYVVTTRRTESGTIRDYLSNHLPEFMIPSAFIALKALPRTSSGKVDRLALPDPNDTRSELQSLYVAPRTPIEEEIVRIWQEVLGAKQVGIYDNFFELGGHSLSITQLASRIWNVFQVEIPLALLFNNPTVVDMTAVIASAQANQGDEAGVTHLLEELRRLSPGEVKTLLENEKLTYSSP
jgi:amino acid adenylation domain-containing protein